MVGTAADTTTVVANKATAAMAEHTTTGATAVSNNKTYKEESNLVNFKSIVGCTDAIVALRIRMQGLGPRP